MRSPSAETRATASRRPSAWQLRARNLAQSFQKCIKMNTTSAQVMFILFVLFKHKNKYCLGQLIDVLGKLLDIIVEIN